MKTVYKYALPFDDVTSIDMPEGAVPMSVANQKEQLVVYAIVNKERKRKKTVRFRVCGTGHPLDDVTELGKFLGTVLFRGGDFVVHVWELWPKHENL